jgi:hypothetical protein
MPKMQGIFEHGGKIQSKKIGVSSAKHHQSKESRV